MTMCINVLLFVLAASGRTARGSVFLEKATDPTEAGFAGVPILEELEGVLGTEHRAATESRIKRLEEAIRPTFMAMPKGADGGLAPDGVRYVLHRIFVDRHGWYVKGLDTVGESWNSSSPAAIFQDHGGGEAHEFFDKRLSQHGFNLHHIAVLAATLEIFVHAETLDRLHAAYSLLNLSRHEDSGDEEETAQAIDTYLLLYVLGSNTSKVTPPVLANYWKHIDRVYPTWEATRTWARGVRQEVLDSEAKPAPEAFNTTVQVLETVADRYGRWQDQECRDLKTLLVNLEQASSGRVKLSTFYASALEGNWQFSENIAYLRQLGALDESDPKALRVIIPNYINAPSNCVAGSNFYSVCCIDECEGLQAHLETHIAAPDASVDRIIELVSELPSPTTTVPRTLPSQLVQRLKEIAEQHDGMVPLHSRLFAQWMHHAFPRECSYPHMTGTTKPVTADQWMKQTGGKATASKDSMQWHVDQARQRVSVETPADADAGDLGELPWSSEEELTISRPALPEPQRHEDSLWKAGRGLAFFVAVMSISLMLFRTFMKVTDAVPGVSEKQKLFV